MSDVKEISDGRPDHVLALLGYVLDGFRRELGLHGTPRQGLRSSQVRLLSLTPAEGMRVTDLAERVGMTKQALGEFANALEEKGLLFVGSGVSGGEEGARAPAVSANKPTFCLGVKKVFCCFFV